MNFLRDLWLSRKDPTAGKQIRYVSCGDVITAGTEHFEVVLSGRFWQTENGELRGTALLRPIVGAIQLTELEEQ